MRKYILLLLSLVIYSGCSVMGDPNNMTNEGKAIVAVAKRVGLRQIRSYLRKNTKEHLEQDPSMSYDQYQKEMISISKIGRDQYNEIDELRSVIRSELEAGIKRGDGSNNKHGEPDYEEEPVDLVQWGPIAVDQEGSIKFNPLKIFTDSGEGLFIKPAKEDKFYEGSEGLPILKDTTELSVRVKLGSIRPFKLLKHPQKVIRKYRFSAKINHYTGVTHRKMFSSEIELDIHNEGEVVFSYNFIIPLR